MMPCCHQMAHLAAEAHITSGWRRWAGSTGCVLGADRYSDQRPPPRCSRIRL